eukprot:5164636-Amphidinium_carterae.1
MISVRALTYQEKHMMAGLPTGDTSHRSMEEEDVQMQLRTAADKVDLIERRLDTLVTEVIQ